MKKISQAQSRAPSNGHTRAKAPLVSLDMPGRLRVSAMLYFYGVAHSTFYAGLKLGRYPAPDGYDGKIPYWHTHTVREHL